MTWTLQHATLQHTCEKSYAQRHLYGSAANTWRSVGLARIVIHSNYIHATPGGFWYSHCLSCFGIFLHYWNPYISCSFARPHFLHTHSFPTPFSCPPSTPPSPPPPLAHILCCTLQSPKVNGYSVFCVFTHGNTTPMETHTWVSACLRACMYFHLKTHTTGRDRHDDEDMYVPLQTAFEAGRCSSGVYVCVCVIVCVFVCVCTRTRLYMWVRVFAHVCVCECVCVYAHTHIHAQERERERERKRDQW